jgi:competence protein ComEA
MDQAKATARSESGLLATWPRCVQVTVAVLLALGIGYVLGRGFASDSPRHTPDDPQAFTETTRPQLNLNLASRAELALLPGMGPSRAKSVEDYRRGHGPFATIDDLRKVTGIGPKTLEKVRPLVFVDATGTTQSRPAEPPDMEVRPASASNAKSNKESKLTDPINVNSASIAELQKLPGIGPKLAQRIVDERTLRGRFKSVDELRRVSGIGPKTLEKVRPHVIVNAPIAAAGL